jgi:hypothetical protein
MCQQRHEVGQVLWRRPWIKNICFVYCMAFTSSSYGAVSKSMIEWAWGLIIISILSVTVNISFHLSNFLKSIVIK